MDKGKNGQMQQRSIRRNGTEMEMVNNMGEGHWSMWVGGGWIMMTMILTYLDVISSSKSLEVATNCLVNRILVRRGKH